ncbi:MAG: sugar ABC transporter permease [Anaerolineales bacterium]|nr:sugar ABC transporter permease [Anaerolineales bacterium]NUQ85451.1 sugar ABC transporter permease [Anaerolineales bacterium]
MEDKSKLRRLLPYLYWIVGLLSGYFLLNALISPFAWGITLNLGIVLKRLGEIGGFLFAILTGLALVEIYFYQIFFRQPSNPRSRTTIRGLQYLLGGMTVLAILSFFEKTDLFRLGDNVMAGIVHLPLNAFGGVRSALTGIGLAKGAAGAVSGIVFTLVLVGIFYAVHKMSVPRVSKLGLPYLLILPAFVGVLFLIIYPFMFEIKLAFSNASLGTQATKNAEYGLIYGWQNLVTLFTGTVAKDAKFFDVFFRTVLWTVINVTFHVGGGMGLALLLHRPMKLQGFYRTLLVFPWAIPTTIAAMALRNEFDSRYGLFNILLTDLNSWLVSVSQGTVNVPLLGDAFNWLASNIGPVSWKQDPFWAFVSILISNIWLGIPFMSVIILGGLQSISQEYYEAAEIDGASKFQMFRNITLPLLRPVLTPAIILGVVWTFNKFDVIYLITQGGPQEKTDILVSSMYKAAFQFYRYGFTAMFALVIFVILLIFTLIYLRASGGLKSATE